MESLFWQAIGGVTAVAALIYSFVKGYQMAKSKQKDEGDKMSARVAEIERRGDVQYQELSTRMAGLENSLREARITNSASETRIMSSVERLENKMERIQDLVIKALTNKQTN
jgi:hypothetical protein